MTDNNHIYENPLTHRYPSTGHELLHGLHIINFQHGVNYGLLWQKVKKN